MLLNDPTAQGMMDAPWMTRQRTRNTQNAFCIRGTTFTLERGGRLLLGNRAHAHLLQRSQRAEDEVCTVVLATSYT